MAADGNRVAALAAVALGLGLAACGGGTPPQVVVAVACEGPLVDGHAQRLAATVTRDGRPDPAARVRWRTVSGPGQAHFSAGTDGTTLAAFPLAGSYGLAADGPDGAEVRLTLTIPGPGRTIAGAVEDHGIAAVGVPIRLAWSGGGTASATATGGDGGFAFAGVVAPLDRLEVVLDGEAPRQP